MTWLNIGCGVHRAPEPWLNLDVDPGVAPDVVIAYPDRPCGAWPDGSVERVYLGHVLEHVPFAELPAFLADLRRVLAPDGMLLVVGPDVLRTIRAWHEGTEPWHLVDSVLAGPDTCPENGGYGWWPSQSRAGHAWNCHEQIVVAILRRAGFALVTALPLDPGTLGDWPVVGFAPWQCAVLARKS